jgi:hypothetical protein
MDVVRAFKRAAISETCVRTDAERREVLGKGEDRSYLTIARDVKGRSKLRPSLWLSTCCK